MGLFIYEAIPACYPVVRNQGSKSTQDTLFALKRASYLADRMEKLKKTQKK